MVVPGARGFFRRLVLRAKLLDSHNKKLMVCYQMLSEAQLGPYCREVVESVLWSQNSRFQTPASTLSSYVIWVNYSISVSQWPHL